MEAFDEEYTPENPTVSEPTLSSFTTLGNDDCHVTSIKRSEQEWLTPIPNNIWIYNHVKPIGLTKARVKHSHFYVKNTAVENKSLIKNLTEIIHVKSEKTRIDRSKER
jgi:hypothetical protein